MSLELKREILRRLNQKMKRLGRLNTQKSASMRSLEHSREEYIDRMRQRIDDGDKIEKEKPLERRKLPKSLPQLPEQEIPEFKNITTVQCPSCNRKFLPDRIEKHRQICMGKASRPQFDPKKMRMKGTELESFKPKKPAKEVKKDKGKWRETHSELIDTLRHARKVQEHMEAGGDPRDLPPAPTSIGQQLTSCPHCKRKFGEAAFERHVPICEKLQKKKADRAR